MERSKDQDFRPGVFAQRTGGEPPPGKGSLGDLLIGENSLKEGYLFSDVLWMQPGQKHIGLERSGIYIETLVSFALPT